MGDFCAKQTEGRKGRVGGGRKGGKSWGGIRVGDIKVKGWIDKGGKEGSFLAY